MATNVFPSSVDSPEADVLLVDRCRAQDPAAFRLFVLKHERMVFALLSRMLGPHADLQDLAQETFVRAYRAFPRFAPDGRAKASTWLLTIATRLALDSRRKERVVRRALDPDGEPELSESPSTPELSLERRQLGEAIAEAAATLPDDQRAALLLADLHGLSMREIAEALDTSEATAKTKLFRAREKMRAILSQTVRPS